MNSDFSNKYTATVTNKLDTLQETSERHTPNDKFENFLIAIAEWISTKPRTNCRVLWETTDVEGKRDNMKKVSLLNKRNPTNAIAQKL